MTNEKARDFFSAYFEGNLEPGLCVSFEQKLKADGNLKEDYEAFVRAMDSLDVLKFEEITVPHDLHEKISARLDRHIYESKRKPAPLWGNWFRGFAFAGLGAVAILFSFVAINSRSNGPGQAGTGGGIGMPKEVIGFTGSPEGVTLSFAPASEKTVIVTNAEGKEVSRSVVGNGTTREMKTLLSNSLPGSAVFGIQIVGESGMSYVVVPGRIRSSINKGDGTIVELAKAVSDFYRVPVSLEARVPNQRASWLFGSSDAVGESSKALGSNYNVTLMKNGMLEIDQK